VEAVPLSWARSNEDESLCAWPPYPPKAATRIMHAISERIHVSADWSEYAVKLIKKCGQFNFSAF